MPQRWLRTFWVGKRVHQPRRRISRYFDCSWQSQWGEERARVSSLSANGCYIESRFSVPADGVVIRELSLALPTGALSLRGTVLEAMPGVGFAVRFSDLDTQTRDRLKMLVHTAQR
jgi:PilZ domain-containing protein